ncbi:hypothetical protein NFI96_002238 [Prochilodus magdalenae]|nr:hypothetical protein NFI96_002238 [Prochilodus magdalenae]
MRTSTVVTHTSLFESHTEAFLCAVTEAIEIPQFTGRSYLTYDNQDILKRVSGSRTNVFMRFKSTSADGLLMWRGSSPMRANSDFLSLGLQNGALMFSYNLGSGAAAIVLNGTFSDGKWHRVKAVRDGQFGKLTVDDYGAQTGRSPGKMRQLNINGDLYVGGMKEIALYTSRQYLAGTLQEPQQLTPDDLSLLAPPPPSWGRFWRKDCVFV